MIFERNIRSQLSGSKVEVSGVVHRQRGAFLKSLDFGPERLEENKIHNNYMHMMLIF